MANIGQTCPRLAHQLHSSCCSHILCECFWLWILKHELTNTFKRNYLFFSLQLLEGCYMYVVSLVCIFWIGSQLIFNIGQVVMRFEFTSSIQSTLLLLRFRWDITKVEFCVLWISELTGWLSLASRRSWHQMRMWRYAMFIKMWFPAYSDVDLGYFSLLLSTLTYLTYHIQNQ